MRPRRLRFGLVSALALTLLAGLAFGGTAIANEIALRDRAVSPAASRFGPTDPGAEPPFCGEALTVGTWSRLDVRFVGRIDGRPIGSVDLTGIREGADFRWLAYVATVRELGQYGSALSGARAWQRTPGDGWVPTGRDAVNGDSLDLQAVRTALKQRIRSTAAEDRGIEVIEGARARRCRVAVDGPTFRAAFPQIRWLVGDVDLGHWVGQLDYWVFLDGQLGQVAGNLNGHAAELRPEAIQATIEVLLTATERGREVVVYPPAP